MKINKTLFLAMVLVLTFFIVPAVAGKEFQNALTEDDLPDGFTLVQTTTSSETNLSQIWKTPSDDLGLTTLSVLKYNNSDDLDTVWNQYKILGTGDSVSFSGAEESLNVSLFGLHIYYAKVGNYIVFSSDIASEFKDVKTLMEAQIGKLKGASSPGFTLGLLLLAFGSLALVIKKKR